VRKNSEKPPLEPPLFGSRAAPELVSWPCFVDLTPWLYLGPPWDGALVREVPVLPCCQLALPCGAAPLLLP